MKIGYLRTRDSFSSLVDESTFDYYINASLIFFKILIFLLIWSAWLWSYGDGVMV